MPISFLGLGSNVGNRFYYIKRALNKINEIVSVKIVLCSSLYETEPWGIKEQNSFLNCVLKIETALHPDELLKEIKNLETEIGRENRERWKEREIDIDILFYDDLVYKNELLQIPHSEIADRKFVLIPMNEIAPDLIHPVNKKKINELLEITKDDSEVRIFKLPENEEFIF